MYSCKSEAINPSAAIRSSLVKRWGFTDAEIKVMFVDNPRRLFSTTRI